MKLVFLSTLVGFVLSVISFAQNSPINIVPKPQSVNPGDGVYELSSKTSLVAKNDDDRRLADFFNEFLQKNYGFKLKIDPARKRDANAIMVTGTINGFTFPPGGYQLSVEKDRVGILASDQAGRFYALQSLMQLLPVAGKGKLIVPAVTIKDEPRFGYRGMHLDVGRHFMPVEFVKKYIDLMSQYKFNYFHWHLTEDQGWRVEIKKYPKLTEIGSKRPESVLGRNLQPYVGDNTPVEGFYTQDQIRDIVAYAKARFITIIPEIDLPGHSSAALAAYPELGCKDNYNYKVQTTWGIFKEVYCPTPKTFQFLDDVLGELIDLFPDTPYIHIGGDEVLKDHWKESPQVKELMEREGLKDVNEVQSYIIHRVEKFINSRGKKIIGWDEILEGGIAPNATVMSWRGIRGGIEAAKARHDVIMTPTDFAYFDFGQGDPTYEPINIGNYLPLEKVYSFDPVPRELLVDEAKHILGGQGNVWTEYMQNPEKVEYMAFPRVLALSEALWTRPEYKDYVDFSRRLTAQLPRLEKQDVNFRIPEPVGLKNMVLGSDQTAVVTLTPTVGRIYYTIDGTVPDEKSAVYEKPIEIAVKPNQRVDLKTIVMLPSGRKSSVYGATLLGRDYLPAVELTEKRAGATYGFLVPAKDGSAEPLIMSGETKTSGFQQFAKTADLKSPFAVTFDGYANAPADGIYEIQIDSTWDATILIDGEKVIDDSGTKDRKTSSAVIPLKTGFHKISLRYNHRGGDATFRVRWGLKGQGMRSLGGAEMMH